MPITRQDRSVILQRYCRLVYNSPMGTVTSWLSKLGRYLPRQVDDEEITEFRTTFQWDYEPISDVNDDSYALVDIGTDDSRDPFQLSFPSTAPPENRTQDSRPSNDAYPANAVVTEHETEDSAPGTEGVTLAKREPREWVLQHQLDIALAEWHSSRILPSLGLLHSALIALDAGYCLLEDQISLLLRAALHHRRGILTALKYQDDSERTALIISQHLTAVDAPLSPDVVVSLLADDPRGESWRTPLMVELGLLTYHTDARSERLAVEALRVLQGKKAEEAVPHDDKSAFAIGPLIGVAGIGLAAVITLWLLIRIPSHSDAVWLPAGDYSISNEGINGQIISVPGLMIDKHEVTNQEYRQCVISSECTSPTHANADYYHNSKYATYPVAHIMWEQADVFCRTRGKRLPTAEEWTLAATAAPTTGIALAFPWGNETGAMLANTFESQLQRPVEVGSYSPAGDSPVGATDMVGNVAEWTSTTSDGGASYVVKGGSFRDPLKNSLMYSDNAYQNEAGADWIGFRCVEPSDMR